MPLPFLIPGKFLKVSTGMDGSRWDIQVYLPSPDLKNIISVLIPKVKLCCKCDALYIYVSTEKPTISYVLSTQ
jgi:hypothetical protein